MVNVIEDREIEGKTTEEAKEIDIWMKLQNVIRFGALTMELLILKKI